MKIGYYFKTIAERTSYFVGTAPAFIVAFTIVILWLMSGPLLKFSDTWQLVINTATTIVTFLMVFLLQNTQNRNSKAVHLKLDHIIDRLPELDNKMEGIEKKID